MPRSATMALRALINIAVMAAIAAGLHYAFKRLAGSDSFLYWYLVLFTWRYLRFLVNLVAFWCYRPARRPKRPSYYPCNDVTAVIPTVDPHGDGFRATLKSCADNGPARIIVVAAGDELYDKAFAFISSFSQMYPNINFDVRRTQVASKRAQVALAAREIDTRITVLLDDHVFWGPQYLESLLYPFEDDKVGLVGTNKRVLRLGGTLWERFWNMLGATYLCRHNFEIRATNTVDGGVFVVSGRTCAIRTEILQHPEFLPGYENECFFFGLFGPLNPDDDNYVTRFVVRHGWRIKIQYNEESVMKTTIGVEKPLQTKFLGQCRRWVRTTWRSNICSLVTDRTVWATQPYCVYAVYLTSLTNFAAIVDPLLVYLLTRSSLYSHKTVAALVGWILFTKTIKVFDFFRRNPQDIILFPAYVAFAYFHSLIKFWALLTFWDCTWSGRRLDQIKVNNPAQHQESAMTRTLLFFSKPETLENDYISSSHLHIVALRALNNRIMALHAGQAEHIDNYQQPLLAELRRLAKSFELLSNDHHAIADNQDEIREVLSRVVGHAEKAATEVDIDAAKDTDIAKALEDIGLAVGGLKEKWRRGSKLAKKASKSVSDQKPSSGGK